MYLCLDSLLVFLVLTNLLLLGSSRLSACIRIVAFQGIIMGFLPFLSSGGKVEAGVAVLAIAAATLKGIVFPAPLFRALRAANVRREVEPLVSYTLSVLLGVAALVVSMWLSSRLPLPVEPPSRFFVPVALATVLTGSLVIVSRAKALTQVLGYLVMENGIYAFGIAVLLKQPLLVELGVLLDVFVAVFVMGIAIFHISREFDSIDTLQLSALAENPPAGTEGEK